MEARLPPAKLEYLVELLNVWRTRHYCTLRELQELAGFLQFTSQVFPLSRAFIRSFYDFAATFSTNFTVRHLPSQVK